MLGLDPIYAVVMRLRPPIFNVLKAVNPRLIISAVCDLTAMILLAIRVAGIIPAQRPREMTKKSAEKLY